jgi:signal peptidase
MARQTPARWRGLRMTGQVLAWLVILATSVVVTIAVLVPRIGGATPYVLLTGSMRPTMPPGTLVVVRPTPASHLGIGDVVTYQLRSGDPTVVTHRVVAVGRRGDGTPVFQTKGDANDVADAGWVRPVQVKGERWYAVPYLGYLTTLVTGQQRHVALLVVVSALFLYAALMFLAALRDRLRRDRHRQATT